MIVFFWTSEDTIRRPQGVFLLLDVAEVFLKPPKSHLVQKEANFLKNASQPGQLLVTQKIIKSLAQALPPRDQMEIKR